MESNKATLPHTISITIYILYLASILIPPLSVIGVIFAYVFENDGEDYLKSHYVYQIRTFWMGLLYLLISLVLIPLIVGIILMVLSLIWWLIRNTKGLKGVLQQKPILNTKTWKF